jgi:hypothetical protein
MPQAIERKMVGLFELKSLSEDGTFEGAASPYGVTDLGGDIVEPGAFTKTIAERGSKVRLLDGHTIRVGIASVSETPTALMAKGRLNLGKSAGRDAYSDLKFYQENGLPMGLSIGYFPVKSERDEKGIRHLKEIRLHEISVTEFPMNESATVHSVKSMDGAEDALQKARQCVEEAAKHIASIMDIGTSDGAADGTPETKAAENVPPEPVKGHSDNESDGIKSLLSLVTDNPIY